MEFFERLGKTVAEASQKTIAKTKEFADTSKLNMMISDEEKNIMNQYTLIGKMYVDEHKEDYEGTFADMFRRIQESEDKIQDYKKQIQDIKGVQRCKHCGAEIPTSAAFCTCCGKPVAEVEQEIPKEAIVENSLEMEKEE